MPYSPKLRCLGSRFAVRSGSNRHRLAAISNRTIRTYSYVFPAEPQSPNGKNINLQRKSGVSADSGKSAKKRGKPHFFRIFCAPFCAISAVFCTFWHSFWNQRKPHFFCRLMFCRLGSEARQEIHKLIVAFQTQTQNLNVLATQFPKSHPCPWW